MKERLPYLALALFTGLPTACIPDLNWKEVGTYEDCGFEDKGIPKNHLILVRKQTRIFTPDRFTVVEDYGVHPTCVERLAQTQQVNR